MCNPPMVAAGLGVATAFTGYKGEQAAANAQAAAQAQQSKAERQRLLQQQGAERINQRFQEKQSAVEMQKAQVKAMEARATARTSAGESGVSGVSVDALMNDLTRKQAIYNFGFTEQYNQNRVATDLRIRDNVYGSNQRLLSINKPIKKPDLFGNLLKGASTGLSAFGTLDS